MNALFSRLTFNKLCIAAFVLRVVLLLYGEYQDAYFTVKYTDIDYVVFTDAARYITEGKSPYLRETYRYTPLLAILLTPNIFWFRSFGKCLFASADLLCGYLIHRILVLRGMPSKSALRFDALWLLNPMVANISTRGNAESLLGVMVLGTFYLVLTRRYFYSACLVFGLSVHFKIYPVIYAIPLLMLLDDHYGNPFQQSSFLVKVQHVRFRMIHELDQQLAEKDSIATKIMRGVVVFLSPVRILFGIISAFVFFALTASMYQQYGDEFMQHTYLYHVTREDHRHNFSIWFYQMYLGIDNTSSWMGLVAFVPQLTLVAVIGIAFGKDLFFAAFMQTFIFVTFNKVITSQYFMWYICLFPLILPSSKIKFRWRGLQLLLAWVAGQGLWLNFAYQLEFLGQNTFLQLWIAGVTFFVMNCWIVVELILNHQYEPIYGSSGRIRWVWGNGDPGSKRSL
ncbi:Alginate_lyase domain-containing protein [Mucor velutinosus]|uniref:GPI mannosyltransferase 1 n=1 Tax=Mucor velutinosus TaxID=708070 RepID=A0AAN7DMU8_9FUNG|nr:Alginate_lyase domain-containing protein [Mucor velutinosus]